ncbi:AraC family transcriptional regulator [Chromobacterium amazonense]|uniref:AraC family transcriptional regulator n=1 Tax=Chromobacterium amazonense TaxID=1382803 RepID=UPI000583ACE6|nr:helix-turn-helix transcriptional regulator [Chromobacterium amazonense]KIA80221.1 AraC family transcriptional regulator [Chromobacterium piscinae]MBM2884696.1 helix-turn-helix transcriptional regulator [Chromobacterium amazonense]MDE1715017.1 helix-turn-helix transcriptional regulator [Chromobacterium amazonense]OHX17283.1 AraC family transcriptional regulator [Chromobacterium amazonense]
MATDTGDDYFASDSSLPEPAPLTFRYHRFTPKSEFARHRHRWGQLNRISLGLVELLLDEGKVVAPAQYLLWTPPEVPHAAYIRQAMHYTSIYVCDELAARLPGHTCLIEQTPLVRALLDDFSLRQITVPSDPWDIRQAELLCRRLQESAHEASYLPDSPHKLLRPILDAIRQDPADATPLKEWAEKVYSTERTLARLFQRELGISFGQWRGRARLVEALARLRQGDSVQAISAQLGYATPSAFIAMFQKQLGASPERYRRQFLQAGQWQEGLSA